MFAQTEAKLCFQDLFIFYFSCSFLYILMLMEHSLGFCHPLPKSLLKYLLSSYYVQGTYSQCWGQNTSQKVKRCHFRCQILPCLYRLCSLVLQKGIWQLQPLKIRRTLHSLTGTTAIFPKSERTSILSRLGTGVSTSLM